jgi:hypothetical protein
LIAEKINKNERKSKSEIEVVTQGGEEMPFWRALNVHSAKDVSPIKVVAQLFCIYSKNVKGNPLRYKSIETLNLKI